MFIVILQQTGRHQEKTRSAARVRSPSKEVRTQKGEPFRNVADRGFLLSPPRSSRTRAHSKGEDCTSMKLNRALFLATLTLVSFTAGAGAQTQTASNAAPAIGPAAAAAATPAAVPAPPVTIADIQALKDALAAQQQQIAALQAQLQIKNEAAQPASVAAALPAIQPGVAPTAAPSSTAPATVAANLQDQPSTKATQNSGSSDERIRNLEREIQGLGPISFSGDVRLRAEPFFGGPTDQDLDRARAPVRARFNINADLGDQFRAGLTLSSGDINDPTSTNQTLTGFYTRKAIALDQAFVEFRDRKSVV